jgi:hypothetical protein
MNAINNMSNDIHADMWQTRKRGRLSRTMYRTFAWSCIGFRSFSASRFLTPNSTSRCALPPFANSVVAMLSTLLVLVCVSVGGGGRSGAVVSSVSAETADVIEIRKAEEDVVQRAVESQRESVAADVPRPAATEESVFTKLLTDGAGAGNNAVADHSVLDRQLSESSTAAGAENAQQKGANVEEETLQDDPYFETKTAEERTRRSILISRTRRKKSIRTRRSILITR